MRRMISEALQTKIKALFQSIWADDSGNVEIGKNLTVDGKLRLNDKADIVGPTNKPLIESFFSHSLTLTAASVKYYVDITLTTNQPIDSPQDLTLYVGISKRVGLGNKQLAYDSAANLWRIGTDPVTDVKDSITTV